MQRAFHCVTFFISTAAYDMLDLHNFNAHYGERVAVLGSRQCRAGYTVYASLRSALSMLEACAERSCRTTAPQDQPVAWYRTARATYTTLQRAIQETYNV